jgi:hypothetical protein
MPTQKIIQHLLQQIKAQGFKVAVHFELEGVCELAKGYQQLDYQGINQGLAKLGIDGELKTEFWKNQWEYVSLFNGQSPLQEAHNLARSMALLPALMAQYGAANVLMAPVAWSGDQGRYVSGSGAIFSLDKRSVHIPNAIQMNISVQNSAGDNLFAEHGLGEWVQQQLLVNSYSCCLLFLPEEDAFKRLALRDEYGLDAELSSPVILSGGHQGSIALYKKVGKHNQPMGVEPLFYAADNSVLHYSADWKKTARVEHRIGATSKNYDPYMNVLFILLNVLDALTKWQGGGSVDPFGEKELPKSLYDQPGLPGALSLFEDDTWLVDRVNFYCEALPKSEGLLGQEIKSRVLRQYQKSVVTLL